MKCPKCKQEGFGIIKMMRQIHTRNDRALFGCKNEECGYKEVIG